MHDNVSDERLRVCVCGCLNTVSVCVDQVMYSRENRRPQEKANGSWSVALQVIMASSDIIKYRPQMRFAMLLGVVDQKPHIVGCGVLEHAAVNMIRKINKGRELNKHFFLADHSMVNKMRGGEG